MINSLDIFRDNAVITTIDIDKSTVFNEKLQSTKLITCPVTAPQVLDVQEGDYTIHKDEVFMIHLLPEFSKDSTSIGKKYKMTFEAEWYQFLDEFVIDNEGRGVFPYSGDARALLQLIIDNANRGSKVTWLLGEVDDTEVKSMDFNWTYARTSLDDIATLFGLEYQFTGRTLRMVKTIGRDTGLVFKYGRGKGLEGLTRVPDTSRNVVNRVYAIGGTRNIPAGYRGSETNLIIEGRYIETPGVTAGTERLKEGKYENEDIYPHFEGHVTSYTVLNNPDGSVAEVTITDNAIDFDIMANLMPDTKVKVGFTSGALMGIEFEVSAFNYATKTVTLINNTDTNGYITPNTLNLPAVGDLFTFYDLIMPAAYVAKAEADLLAAATLYLNDNKNQRLVFTCKPDKKYLRNNGIHLRVGDLVTLVETDINTDSILRFVEISYPLVDEFDVSATVGDGVIYDKVVKLFADVNAVHQQVAIIDKKSQEVARRGAINNRLLIDSIFATDGKLRPDIINVGVLMSDLNIVGTLASNFLLNSVYVTDNYNGDPNAVHISAGQLIHLELSNPGKQNVWQMQEYTLSGMAPASLYYIYCKISKTSQAGSFMVTTDQIVYDSLDGFYTLLMGHIYPVLDGTRDTTDDYGITTVSGGRIRTGTIEGHTGLLVINVDTGEIFGKLTFKGSNGTIVDVSTVNNTAILAQANALAAQTLADNANAELADIASDSKLTPNEKVTVSRDLTYINQEYPVRIQGALPYGVSIADYTTAYNALNAYVNGNGLLTNLNATSDIVSADFKNAFANYYAENVNLTKAISDAANHKIDSINVGGRNYFRRNSTLQNITGSLLALQHVNGDINGVSGVTNGIFATGNPNSLSLFRIPDVITKNGDWTISGYIRSNGDFGMTIDVCDNVPAKDISVTSSGFTYFEVTVNVQNHSDAVYNFVDFNNIPYVYLYIKNLKIEQGNKATDWTEAPEDLQADLDDAITQSSQALAELTAIADDSILDVSEKVGALKDFRAIAANIDSREHQAMTYGLSIADIDSKYHALVDYVTPLFNNMSINSPIDRDEFINKFNDYYRAEQALLQAVTDAANGRIQAKTYSSGKMLYTDPEFSGSYGQNGYNGIAVYNNAGNGTVSIGRGVNYSDFASGGLPANPNSTGCYIAIAYNGGVASPGLGGFFFGNQTRANAVFITRIVAMIPVGYVIQWQSNQFGEGGHVEWLTSQAGSGKWEEYIVRVTCGSTGTFSTTNFFNLEGAGAVNWYLSYASVFDMSAAPTDPIKYADVQTQAAITQANATAATIAQSKVDIAKAATLAQASTDAQAKADAMYNASLAASKNYADTVSNSAASSVQIAAAADASNKANAAATTAQAAADAKYSALTGQLKTMAYRDITAVDGVVSIDNGAVIAFRLDVAYARVNVLKAEYINALALDAVQGTIGGILINGSGIYSGNGTFYINNSGQLYCTQATISGTINATSGSIAGFSISGGRIVSGGFVLDPTKQEAFFSNTDNGLISSRIGSQFGLSSDGYSSPASFINHRNAGVSTVNIALIVSAMGTTNNYAIDILNGGIRIQGSPGFTGYLAVSGANNQFDKYIGGICLGRGSGAW